MKNDKHEVVNQQDLKYRSDILGPLNAAEKTYRLMKSYIPQ